MKKARRCLGLFLASVLSLSNFPTQIVKADSGVTSLKVSVVGEGTVVLDDYESQYTLESGDTFKANCTVDTKLKITINANEGNSIQGVSENGNLRGDIQEGAKSHTYEYSVPTNGGDVKITFVQDKVETPSTPVVEESKKEELPKQEEIKNESSNEVKEEEKAEEPKKEEVLSEEAIIGQYLLGNNMKPEIVEARKKLATEKGLLDQVDKNFFLTKDYLADKSSAFLMDEGLLILVDSLSTEEMNAFLQESLANFVSSDSNVAFRSARESLVVGNAGAYTEYYGGYAHTAPMLSIDGKQAFCVMFDTVDPSSGTIAYNKRLSSNNSGTNDPLLRKVLYYGYRGPGTGSISSSWSNNQNLLMIATTQAASYANGHKTYSLGRDFANYVSQLPAPPSSFITYIVSTGTYTQDMAYWEMQRKGSLQISKESADPSITNGNSYYSLTGAQYGVYSNSSATSLITTLTIGSNGWSSEIDLDAGTYYVKETKAPKGYALDSTIYPITVSAGSKATKTFKDRPQNDPIAIMLKKLDADTGSDKPQGSGSLADAQFTIKYYGGEYPDGVNPANLGVSPTRTWVMKTNSNGIVRFDASCKVSGDDFYYQTNGNPTIPLGTITIQETKAPTGYKINPEVFVRRITPNGTLEGVGTFNEVTVKEDSLDFTIKKVQSGTTVAIPNTTFRYTKPDGSVSELKTGSNGEVVIRGLQQGVHKIVETGAPEGYEVNKNEFQFEVTQDNTIRVISNTSNIGMSYSEFEGNGMLTVGDDLKPFKLKVVKVNDKNNFLEGAEFTLYSDADCKNEVGKAISNNKGELSFDNLKVGTKYYLKETKAPQGYRIPVDSNGKVHVYEITTESIPANGVFNFTVDGTSYTSSSTSGDIHLEGTKDDRVISIKVVNSITMKLPNTGSSLMIPVLLLGSALMVVAIVMNRKSIKKNQI